MGQLHWADQSASDSTDTGQEQKKDLEVLETL